MSSHTTNSRRLAHIGLSVDDLDRAIDWYRDVLGFELLLGPITLRADGSVLTEGAVDVFGPRFGAFRQAHMSMGDSVGIELFEFIEPKAERPLDNFEYWKNGFFHLCLVDPEIDALAERIVSTGGKLRTTRIWELFDGEPYRFCYCEDPFGNIIELYTHTNEEVWRNREQS